MKYYNKFIPTKFANKIEEINYDTLQEQGIKALFFDLDNTIIPYDINMIPENVSKLLLKLQERFTVIVVSNSRYKRVSTALSNIKDSISFVKFSRKPLKFGFKQALKLANVKASEVCLVGDQIMTDIYGGNRMRFGEVILVYPIKKRSDHFFTRINRFFERRIIKKIKKNNFKKYEEVLKAYDK